MASRRTFLAALGHFRPAGWWPGAGLALVAAVSVAAGAAIDGPGHYQSRIRPVLKQYCLDCHSTEKQKGELNLEVFDSLEAVRKQPKIWQNVIEQLASNEMPPKDSPQPSAAERERLTGWVRELLDGIARAGAGDPGQVVLRRLSNAEFTHTIRDLTGVDSLDPAGEFPVDGAAGEGFTNTGQALVMSPSLLTKFLDAAKEIAGHAVLVPDGIHFSPATTRRDWTEEILGNIRALYREFTDSGGADSVNLQGIVFDTNGGGRLPLEAYLAATIDERDALTDGGKSLDDVARSRGLSSKYLATLWSMLHDRDASLVLDTVRARWRSASRGGAPAVATDIAGWQQALWKFNTVGHIGKVGGPPAWMEPLDPLAASQDIRFPMPPANAAGEVTFHLVVTDAGDGNTGDTVVWSEPRLVAPGRPTLLLRDVRDVCRELDRRRARIFGSAAACLAAAAAAAAEPDSRDAAGLARRHGVEPEILTAWLDYLGIGSGGPVIIDSLFRSPIPRASTYEFIQGWGSSETPLVVANSSDQEVRIPGVMKPHSVAVHPGPKTRVAVGWRSPVAARVRVEAAVTHAHPECGNGVTWSLERRRARVRQRLASGNSQGATEVRIGLPEPVAVEPGDFISLLVGPRDGNHSCDLTAVDLVVTTEGDSPRHWTLAGDVSPKVLDGNPHADRLGNPHVWHFYTEPDDGSATTAPVIPPGSLIARWQAASAPDERSALAEAVQSLLSSPAPDAADTPDAQLHRQLTSLSGPLISGEIARLARTRPAPALPPDTSVPGPTSWGIDPDLFGHHPQGGTIDPASICLPAPSVVEVRLPADLVAGATFVTTGRLDPASGADGSVQIQVLASAPPPSQGLVASAPAIGKAVGPWTDTSRIVVHGTPILVHDAGAARRRFEAAFDDFRRLFPLALCYEKIVPVDEVVTLTLFHREDDQLVRLMLDDVQWAKLDRLWDELHYVSHDALTLVDAFGQLMEYATQDADPKVFEPLRVPINDRAAAFRRRLVDTETAHLDAVIDFAARAFRRPLTGAEAGELRGLYRKFRSQELPHEEAIRLTLARVLVAPAFLYRTEIPCPGGAPTRVSDWELASRLSYFLWSSLPDAQLRESAAAGHLGDPEAVAIQARRMLADPRARRLATEFACQWLHIRDFDTLDEKSERHFPTFGPLRATMYEESVRFFTDFFQANRSVKDILDADHTFLNEPLAEHYGIPAVTGDHWRRVDGIKSFARGGILTQAATLAKQSGASRTSPILRGNWVSEVLLGEKLPRPPKDVPPLPEDEAIENLTVRQLTEIHSSDPRCASCHVRIDAFGYALERFDAIGRHRALDLGGRPIETRAKVMDGTEIDGVDGLRNYLLDNRGDAFLRQFCKKLLGYALGRAVQLSDEPLLTEIQSQLKASDHRIGAAIEAIVRSRQFREIRGREMPEDG